MQRIMLLTVGLIVLVVLAAAIFFWRRPITVANLLNRRALTNAGFNKTKVRTPVGIVTVFMAGTGPTLVLLHGAGDQAGAWAKVAPELAKHYRVVIPDLPGHGDSDPRTGPLGIGAIFSGIEFLANDQPGKVILVGNSLGGWIASLYAHNHPQKVERLVLVNGGPLIGDRPDITLTPKNREEARTTIAALFDPGSFQIPDFVVDDMVREAQTGPLMRITQAADQMPKFLLEGRMSEITVPTNLVWGESDHVMSLAYAHRMLAQLPNAQITTLKRCGHAPALECPKAFTAALTDALNKPVIPQKDYAGAEAK